MVTDERVRSPQLAYTALVRFIINPGNPSSTNQQAPVDTASENRSYGTAENRTQVLPTPSAEDTTTPRSHSDVKDEVGEFNSFVSDDGERLSVIQTGIK